MSSSPQSSPDWQVGLCSNGVQPRAACTNKQPRSQPACSTRFPGPSPSRFVRRELCDEIAVLRMVPGFSDNYINAIIQHTPTIRGIVLQLYGTGNAAQRNGSFMAAVQAAIRRGIMVVATTQCAKGGVKLETYA